MPNLEIVNRDGVLVVDSRLIAEEMNIEHTSLKRTIQRYSPDLLEFGDLWTDSQGVNGTLGYSEFYYLNEDQSNLILTYSNNTPIIRQLKIALIKAFKSAKEITIKQQTDLTVLFDVISEVQKNMNLLTERTQKLDKVTQEKLELEEKLEEIDDAGFNNPGAYSVIKADMEQIIDDNYVTVDQYLTSIGLKITDPTKLNRIRRRAAAFYRASKFKEPLKNKKNQTVYSGSEIEYIKSAIKSEIGYIFN